MVETAVNIDTNEKNELAATSIADLKTRLEATLETRGPCTKSNDKSW